MKRSHNDAMEMEGDQPTSGNKGQPEEEYFTSYEDVEIHRLMVSDAPRTQAYADAINKNKHLFSGKVAMDVGAGTGILSLLMAAAGAKKVYAVEASNTAALVEQVAQDNNFGDIIQVIHDKVENVVLLENEKVDVIVSEWMGFYLLHESMLNSVIFARDKFLAEDGTVFPSEARIYASPCSLKTLYKEQITFWDDVYGFNMSAVKKYALKSKLTKPEVRLISESDLLAEPTCIKKFNLRWVTEEEVKFFTSTTFVGITRPGPYQGLSLWFECDFDGVDYNEEGHKFGNLVTLSTSPFSPPTHWKQTVVIFGYGAQQSGQSPGVRQNGEQENCGNGTTASDNTKKNESTISIAKNNNPKDNQSAISTVKYTIPELEIRAQSKNDEESEASSTDNIDVPTKSGYNEIQAEFQNPVEEDEVVGWRLVMSQSEDNVRHYTMMVEMLEPETEEHPVPCCCPMPKCLIIAKMMEREIEEEGIIDCT